MKPVRRLGTTLGDIREQRPAIRNQLGQQLLRVQMGLMPNNYKPMNTVGPGAYETWVFTKKARTTPKTDIDLAEKR